MNFRRDCTGFEFRITKDGPQQSQFDVTLLSETRHIQVDVDGLK